MLSSLNACSLFSGLLILNSHSLHLSVSICLFLKKKKKISYFFYIQTVLLPGSAPSPQSHSFLSLSHCQSFIALTAHLSFISIPVFFALVTGADYVGLSSFGPHAVCGQGQLQPSHSEHGQSRAREPLMWSAKWGDRARGKSTVWCHKNDSICHWCEKCVLCLSLLLLFLLQCHPYFSKILVGSIIQQTR